MKLQSSNEHEIITIQYKWKYNNLIKMKFQPSNIFFSIIRGNVPKNIYVDTYIKI